MKKKDKTYHVKNFYDGDKKLEKVVLEVKNGFIYKISRKGYLSSQAFDIVVPTFVDLQVYGSNQRLLSEYPSIKTLEKMDSFHKKNGTYFFQPTIASYPYEVIYKSLEAVKNYMNQNPESGCIGLHVEGPWFNPNKKGAHIIDYIHRPSEKVINEIIEKSKGTISMITLAPEVIKVELMKKLINGGIILSAGHSDCDYKLANKLLGKIIHTSTHLFNAMPSLHHRELNLTSAILLNQNVYSSIIADGHHVDFEVIRIAHKLKKDKLFCITDAVTETNKGPYKHKNSGLFYVSEDNYSSSLGMPSGHSISAAFIATYLYLYLIEKYKIENPEHTLMPICIIFTLYTMYSRVYIFKVHTIQQTIIGAYLGYILAIYYYKLVKRINPRYNDVINKVL